MQLIHIAKKHFKVIKLMFNGEYGGNGSDMSGNQKQMEMDQKNMIKLNEQYLFHFMDNQDKVKIWKRHCK